MDKRWWIVLALVVVVFMIALFNLNFMSYSPKTGLGSQAADVNDDLFVPNAKCRNYNPPGDDECGVECSLDGGREIFCIQPSACLTDDNTNPISGAKKQTKKIYAGLSAL